jgi:hypothetical protein
MYFSIFHSKNGIPVAEIGALLIWTRSHFAARLRGNAIMSPSRLWHTAEGGDQAILRPTRLNAACAYRTIPFSDPSPTRIATEALARPKSEANWRYVGTEHLTPNGVTCRGGPAPQSLTQPIDAEQSAACDNRSQWPLPLACTTKGGLDCVLSQVWRGLGSRPHPSSEARIARRYGRCAKRQRARPNVQPRGGGPAHCASLRQAREMRFARRDRASACHGSGRSGVGCHKPVVIRSQHTPA